MGLRLWFTTISNNRQINAQVILIDNYLSTINNFYGVPDLRGSDALTAQIGRAIRSSPQILYKNGLRPIFIQYLRASASIPHATKRLKKKKS
jgi:hypothetical protein